jgi:hypothetical protein
MGLAPEIRRRLSSRRAAAGTAFVIAAGALAAVHVRDAICGPPERRREYLLPAGYTGWCMVEYGVPDAPPLSYRGGATIVTIPAGGYLATSSVADLRPGDGNYYFYVSPGGARDSVAAWGKRGGSRKSRGHGEGRPGATERLCEWFFVGTRRQFEATARADRGSRMARGVLPTE